MAIETRLLETDVMRELGASQGADSASHLRRFGGPPYPVEEPVDHELRQVGKDQAAIVASLGARLSVSLVPDASTPRTPSLGGRSGSWAARALATRASSRARAVSRAVEQ